MGEAVGRYPALEAGVALVQIPLGVPFDLDDLIALDPDQQGAAAMVHACAVRFYPANLFSHFSAPFTMIRVEQEGPDLVTDHLKYVNYDTNVPGAGRIASRNLPVMPKHYRLGKSGENGVPAGKFYMSQMTYVVDFTGYSAK